MITSTQLRSRYIEFFVEKGHAVIPSASLVPTNDPTVLFTTAGMHPLVPNLLGEPHAAGTRLVNVQKCIRTGDIDVIGDDTHLTFFEMLGNWSLGDYFRDDAIRWSFEFLTSRLGLPLDRLGVTCFGGDDQVPRDLESARLWQQLGMARVQFLGRDDNWWGPAGKTGPCGPDTEIFYWVDTTPPPDVIDVSDRRWVEIWNNVFMGYAKSASGTIEPLTRVNVDTGMGLERTLVALNGLRSVYEVDTVAPVIDELRRLANTPEHEHEHELRVMTDHLRAACFLISDGVAPTNKDRGYIVRRLLRRSLLFAQRLGMPSDWYERAIDRVVAASGDAYPELARDPSAIARTIADEVERFGRTLTQGLKVLDARTTIDGAVAFDLLQTYGFPFELTAEVALRQGKHVPREGFAIEMEKHRVLSRGTTVAGAFAGGLADDSVEIVRYHTLTHLLHAALREVLGPHVIQRGSNITRERLRFDFSHGRAPSGDELAKVTSLVNGWLARPLVVERTTMSEPEARTLGAIGAFGEKYGATVSVYTISDETTGEVVSREFCGGPHVHSIATELHGVFRIAREQGISTGVRRIRAVLEVEK